MSNQRISARRILVLSATAIGALTILGWVVPPPRLTAAASACANDRTEVAVDASKQVLTLCEGGVPVGAFRVRLGRSGVDKRAEGDGRTPTGRYELDNPRASASGFHTFVPAGYPTAEQRSTGHTGTAIGIHGPPRLLRPLLGSSLVQWAMLLARPNTTAGCIAVDRVGEIVAVADWLEANPGATLIVRP